MTCLEFAKPLIIGFAGGSMAERISDGLVCIFAQRPEKGMQSFTLQLDDDRTGVSIFVSGEMKSTRARNWQTKYVVEVTNRKRHQKVKVHVEDDFIRIKSLDEMIARPCRLRMLDDPSVIFDWLRMNTHPSFVQPPDVIASGNLRGTMYNAAGPHYVERVIAPVTRTQGPYFLQGIPMRVAVYRYCAMDISEDICSMGYRISALSTK
jgi:hypothetical protein